MDSDVVVQAGGPQLNNPQLLAADKLDGVMVTSALERSIMLTTVSRLFAVAGVYQRSPTDSHALIRPLGSVLFADMRNKPIHDLVSST